MYGTMEAIVVALYCIVSWKMGWTKAPADTPFWTFLLTSYEVLMTEEQNEIDQIEVLDADNDKQLSREESVCGNTLNTYYSMDNNDAAVV